MKNTFIAFLVLSLFSLSCKDKEKEELEILKLYLEEHNITTEPTESGLYYIETAVGDGEFPVAGNRVSIDYVGRFLSGEVFDSSGDEPFTTIIGYGIVIPGWDEGIMYMKNGGKATLIIPSSLAYGPEGKGKIPGYSTLIFDIELLGIY